MTMDGLPRASAATTTTTTTTTIRSAALYANDLNPYWNSSTGAAVPTDFYPSANNGSSPFYSSSASAIDELIDIPTEDANNVVSNETVVIYQYGGSGMQTAGDLHLERERIRMEFYATYDVMTGLRIAGTLAAFFGLMVMLVMYKSRRAVRDPKIAAVAAEMVQEEEDRELQEAFDTLEAAGIFSELETLPYRERRLLSLGNISAPPMLSYSPRFSSVGGGSCTLWDPPTRLPANQTSISSRPLPFASPIAGGTGHSRREAFRSSRNTSSADRGQCVSFDMSEMTRRRSDTRAWMGRRATFQSIQSDSLKSRNKVFLSNSRHGRDANRIKLIRLYTTSSSREEDVEEVIEHGDETALPPDTLPPHGRQQSTSTTSFIVSSVDYQDSDLRSVNSESMFSDRYADTEDEREGGSSDDSEIGGGRRAVARLKAGAYQKMEPKRNLARIDDCSVATYEAPSCLRATSGTRSSPPTQRGGHQSACSPSARPRSLLETRTFEMHSLVPKSQSSTSSFGRDSLSAIGGGLTSRDMVDQMLRREAQLKTTEWSKETLF